MNFTYTNNLLILFICLISLFACSTKDIYDKLKVKKYAVLKVENYEQNNITLYPSKIKKINYKKKYNLKEYKNKNSLNVIIKDSKVFAINENKELLEFQFDTGELVSSTKIETKNDPQDIITSFNYINNSFLIGFKSGLLLRINNLGEIIWKFNSFKTLNTPITIFEEQLISLYIDEIKSISITDGSQIWSEVFEDIPVYQAIGGQLVNFINLLFFSSRFHLPIEK